MPQREHWVGSWTTSPAPAENGAFNNHTLRMNMRSNLGGNRVRVRISNAYGRRGLEVGGPRGGLRGNHRHDADGEPVRTVVPLDKHFLMPPEAAPG